MEDYIVGFHFYSIFVVGFAILVLGHTWLCSRITPISVFRGISTWPMRPSDARDPTQIGYVQVNHLTTVLSL